MTTTISASIRAKRVLRWLKANGPEQADQLPTAVAVNWVGFVTDRIELDYDNAVTELLDLKLAEYILGEDGYTYIGAVAA